MLSMLYYIILHVSSRSPDNLRLFQMVALCAIESVHYISLYQTWGACSSNVLMILLFNNYYVEI